MSCHVNSAVSEGVNMGNMHTDTSLRVKRKKIQLFT